MRRGICSIFDAQELARSPSWVNTGNAALNRRLTGSDPLLPFTELGEVRQDHAAVPRLAEGPCLFLPCLLPRLAKQDDHKGKERRRHHHGKYRLRITGHGASAGNQELH